MGRGTKVLSPYLLPLRYILTGSLKGSGATTSNQYSDMDEGIQGKILTTVLNHWPWFQNWPGVMDLPSMCLLLAFWFLLIIRYFLVFSCHLFVTFETTPVVLLFEQMSEKWWIFIFIFYRKYFTFSWRKLRIEPIQKKWGDIMCHWTHVECL